MSMEVDFPKHSIRDITDRIRIRYYQRIKWSWYRNRKHEKKRTWYQCLCRNKTKLLQVSLKERVVSDVDPWKGYLRLQKTKLKFSYDLYTSWQETEIRLLNKMNQRSFIKHKGGLWVHASRMQVQKINGRKSQREISSFKSEKYRIKKQIDKLKNLYRRKPLDQDALNWSKALISSKVKFNHRYNKNWGEACDVLVSKMNRRIERKI
ncbi:hypothetical protein [Leptospira barantonii]|uniref:Transposase n=1 Tax=Leptospira barantonii TaxID=2023184 RepID=A0ABX4NKY2_9LEPT|nr:hypothetical protein [Leptospira barantonii]PJZ57470.1 hypothetical protein CH367_08945 [Leptospira barantonii]